MVLVDDGTDRKRVHVHDWVRYFRDRRSPTPKPLFAKTWHVCAKQVLGFRADKTNADTSPRGRSAALQPASVTSLIRLGREDYLRETAIFFMPRAISIRLNAVPVGRGCDGLGREADCQTALR